MKLSVIVPVYHEDESINHFLRHTLGRLSAVDHEIIVVDGDLDRSTLDLIYVENVIKITADKGRGTQLHSATISATGDIFLFLHADTLLPETVATGLVSLTQRYGQNLCGAFDLHIDSEKPTYRLFEKITSIRSRLTRIPYGDQAIFISKELYEKSGGFRPFPLMEDVDFMRRLKKMGVKLQFISDPVSTSARKWEHYGLWQNTFRNWYILLRYYLGTPPDTLYKEYYGKRLGGKK